MKVVIAALGLALLSGCASNGSSAWSQQSCSKLDSDQELSLSLADGMIGEGKLHAGLANLQRLPDNLVQVRLRKAKIYRQLGQSDAEPPVPQPARHLPVRRRRTGPGPAGGLAQR